MAPQAHCWLLLTPARNGEMKTMVLTYKIHSNMLVGSVKYFMFCSEAQSKKKKVKQKSNCFVANSLYTLDAIDILSSISIDSKQILG